MKIAKQMYVGKMKLLAGILILAGVNVGYAAPVAASQPPVTIPKVAMVNVQAVMQQSPRIAALNKQLETQFKTRQEKITLEQKSLQDELEKFKADEPKMTAQARDAMQKKLTTDRATLVSEVVAYQQDLQKEQNKIMQTILADLNHIVSSIATKQSYSLVMDSQAVIYAENGNDITGQVAKEFNQQ